MGETVMPDKEISLHSAMVTQNEKIEKHDETLEEHSVMLRVQAEQIKQLQDNAIKLENVVMAENRETRLTIIQTNQQLHELINGLMGYNTGNNQMVNSMKMARLEQYVKIIGILAGSGGILYYIFG